VSKRPSITRQIQEKLVSQTKFGESKYQAKIEQSTSAPEGIYSTSTLKTYMKHSNQFGKWAKENYEVKYIDNAKVHVEEYLQHRIDSSLSAWTIKLDSSSLAKLYGCKTTDFKIQTPARLRSDIQRSRNEVAHKKEFSETRNREVVDFAKGTGLRRHEMKQLKSSNLIEKNGKLYVHVERGKGGKVRFAEVRNEYREIVQERFNRVGSGEKIFQKDELKNRMDIHGYRRNYAQLLYKSKERDLRCLSRSEKYFCRKDLAGTVYDKKAMLEVSRNLGHNRIDVIASNYLN